MLYIIHCTIYIVHRTLLIIEIMIVYCIIYFNILCNMMLQLTDCRYFTKYS